jgi:hypothetical protein
LNNFKFKQFDFYFTKYYKIPAAATKREPKINQSKASSLAPKCKVALCETTEAVNGPSPNNNRVRVCSRIDAKSAN